MIKQTQIENGEAFLKFSDYSLSFIYSFLLDLNSRSFAEYSSGSEKYEPEASIPTPLGVLAKILRKEDNSWISEKPKSRLGVTSNLCVDGHKSLYWKGNEFNFELEINSIFSTEDKESRRLDNRFQPLKCTVWAFIRINDNGAGTVTLTITSQDKTSREYSSLDIHNLFNLIGINQKEHPYFQLGKLEGESIPSSLTNSKSTTLFKVFYHCLHENIINKLKDGKWLDEKTIQKTATIKEKHVMLDTEWQNPFVMTNLTLNEDYAAIDEPWWDKREESETQEDGYKLRIKKQQELVSLQARFLKGRLVILDHDHQYVSLRSQTKAKPRLNNFSWHKDVFIGHHGRGGIILNFKNKRETALIEELKESYMDLMEVIRARWHFCVVFDELLSHEFTAITRSNQANIQHEMGRFTELFLKRREMFIRFMSDPTSYAYEGGVVSEICSYAREYFYIDKLSHNLFEKFNAIERYYKEHVDFILYAKRNKL